MVTLARSDKRLLLLSGAVAGGKTSIANALLSTHGFRKINTSAHLSALASAQALPIERTALQNLGDMLDVQTDYRWPVTVALEQIHEAQSNALYWLLDAVRKPQQAAQFRTAFVHVLHVHVIASEEILRRRFAQRQTVDQGLDASINYEAVVCHPNEVASRALGSIADVIYDSGNKSAEIIAEDIFKIIQGLHHGPSSVDQRAPRRW
ncbi:hypothetical protein [Bordetella petrii]|uniref:hypothetical protein n=1 Tax=Bordetella petrii TaxID=94624 RepID=UPI001A9665D8|nr:hypothetical protein [Bordetella petrii]MBO1114263.1 hypothetical protein [Bordetella petrii]